MRNIRETMRKSVIQHVGYRSFYENYPSCSINIDWKQQYMRGKCVGRKDLH